MRKPLVVLALALALAGCSGEAGPTPKGAGSATTPEALATKLRVYTADTCYTAPAKQTPKGCEKYVTELGSSTGMVREQAGTKHPELNRLADQLDKNVGAYRGAHCETVMTAGTPCSATLSDLANTLRDLKQFVDTQLVNG
ncbi:lipoprotein [Amycolatopsis dongchuanensis]|uniref:Lipoprotein n=1 Tax=Amycolatopsis dongchuanensis TaxID=1070866 RepID=A0ABP9QWT9_9PSEU